MGVDKDWIFDSLNWVRVFLRTMGSRIRKIVLGVFLAFLVIIFSQLLLGGTSLFAFVLNWWD